MLGIRTDLADLADESGDGGRRWWDPAVGGRAEIHQASGMVLVQLGVSVTDALARMRGYAFVHQRLLIEVARDARRGGGVQPGSAVGRWRSRLRTRAVVAAAMTTTVKPPRPIRGVLTSMVTPRLTRSTAIAR